MGMGKIQLLNAETQRKKVKTVKGFCPQITQTNTD